MKIIVVIFAFVAIGTLFYFKNKTPNQPKTRRTKSPQPPSPQRTSPKQQPNQPSSKQTCTTPQWLMEELEKYQRMVLSYALYCLSLDDRYSANAKEELTKLGETIYAPPPLLLNDARNRNNCTCKQLDEYMVIIVKEKTGKEVSEYEAQQILEDYLTSQAKEEALKKCS